MDSRIISEPEFAHRIAEITTNLGDELGNIGIVTGPGRSGSIAAVYASHLLSIPFVPYGSDIPTHLGRLLIVDTARFRGRTSRKAMKRYEYANPVLWIAFEEPPRVIFWYEGSKPEKFKHEQKDIIERRCNSYSEVDA